MENSRTNPRETSDNHPFPVHSPALFQVPFHEQLLNTHPSQAQEATGMCSPLLRPFPLIFKLQGFQQPSNPARSRICRSQVWHNSRELLPWEKIEAASHGIPLCAFPGLQFPSRYTLPHPWHLSQVPSMNPADLTI